MYYTFTFLLVLATWGYFKTLVANPGHVPMEMQSKYSPEQLNVKVFGELILEAKDDDENDKFGHLRKESAKSKYEMLNYINVNLDFKRCQKCIYDENYKALKEYPLKPPRCRHCMICDRCCMKLDHHCFVVGNCIGLTNTKYFF